MSIMSNQNDKESVLKPSSNVSVILPNGSILTKDALHKAKKDNLIKYLKPEQVNAFISAIPLENYRDYVLFNLLWKTGIRITEALTIEAGFYDKFTHTLTIRHLKSRAFVYRTIPLRSDLELLLVPYLSQFKAQELIFNITRQRADQLCKEYSKKASIGSWVHCHTFRHSFAINYLTQTNDVVGLKRLMGHSRMNNTMIYLQFTQKDLKDKIDNIKY